MIAEAAAASVWLDNASLAGKGGWLTRAIASWGPWAIRGAIGFCAVFATFASVRYREHLRDLESTLGPVRKVLVGLHTVSMFVFAALSAHLYGPGPGSDWLASAWLLAGLAGIAWWAAALFPLTFWWRLIQRTGLLWLWSVGAAIFACYGGVLSRRLWEPAAGLTFSLVRVMLSPFVRDAVVQPAARRIGTHRFTAVVSPECSGLEGVALLLGFCILWLVLFRNEIRFPRSLVLIPAGVVTLYLLNSMRIAALVLIGDAGAREIATGGFHSQAGWILFSFVAFGLSTGARRLSWISTHPPAPRHEVEHPAAPYLMPFLAILAAGMVSRAASARFEWMYGLRLLVAVAVLWHFRGRYRGIDWRFTWFGPALGAVVFAIWVALERGVPNGTPAELAGAPAAARWTWIAMRAVAAIATVPVAEELAFRGFLLRRLVSENFDAVPFDRFTWVSLVVSSAVFGLLHGGRWLAGTIAGGLFAAAMLWRGRFGEAVAAHVTANLLLAGYVLFWGYWSLW